MCFSFSPSNKIQQIIKVMVHIRRIGKKAKSSYIKAFAKLAFTYDLFSNSRVCSDNPVLQSQCRQCMVNGLILIWPFSTLLEYSKQSIQHAKFTHSHKHWSKHRVPITGEYTLTNYFVRCTSKSDDLLGFSHKNNS